MNKSRLAAAVVCALAGWAGGNAQSAFGADIPVKAPVRQQSIFAPTTTGFYVVAGGSVIFSGGSTDLSERNCSPTSLVPCTVPATITGDGGWGVFGGIGYRFNRWSRGEVRVGYGESSATGNLAPPGVTTVANADFDSTVVMFNAYLDIAGLFAPGTFGVWEPYVGAGLGFARNHGRNISFVFTPAVAGLPFSVPDGSNTDFAWNVSVGTAVRLSAIGLPRNWLFDIAYRYRDLGKVKTAPGNVLNSAGAVIGTTNGFEADARGHGLDFALRYEFY